MSEEDGNQLRPSVLAVVGIGASAGGYEACERFFARAPEDSGLAFVVVQHMDPTTKTMLPELLQRHTRMRVRQVTDGVRVRPNAVYIAPPNRQLVLAKGDLQMVEPETAAEARAPI